MALVSHTEQPPQCFGKSHNATDKLCVGGVDHTFTNSKGEHVRPACAFQASCSIRTVATKHNNMVPSSSLVRPPLLQTPATAPYPTQSPAQPPIQQTRPWQPQSHPSAYWSNQSNHWSQNHGHQNMMPLYSPVPQYLSVREPMNEGRMKRLFVEVGRSIGKSLGHTIANFFDMESFTDDPKNRQ